MRRLEEDFLPILRKIEHYHQGSIVGFKIMYRDSEHIWEEMNWTVNVLRSLHCEIEEGQVRKRLLERK